MRGSFKKKLDIPSVEKFINHLKQSGLRFDTKWKYKNKSLAADDPNNKAISAVLSVDGKKFFAHNEKAGIVVPKHLPQEKHKVLFEGLAKAGIYTEPNFGLGIVLAIVYLLLYFVLVYPRYMEIGGGFYTFGVSMTALMFLGLFTIFLGYSLKQPPLAIVGFAAYIPGAFMGAPLSLLTLCLLMNIMQNAVYLKVKPFLSPARVSESL